MKKYNKKRFYTFLSWLVFVLIFPIFVSGQGDLKIAILDIDSRGISRLEAETLTNYMRFELVETGAASTVESEQIKDMLTQMGLQEVGCTSFDCALEIGRLLGVTNVIMGSINKKDQTYNLSCQMFNVESGDVQKTINRIYIGDVDGLIVTLQRLVWDIIEMEPPPGRFAEDEVLITTPVLTFWSDNWNVPKSVIIYGVDDQIDEGDLSYIITTSEIESGDEKYSVLETPDVFVINTDNDTADIVVEPIVGLATTESGSVDSFRVVLRSEPTAEVSISLSSSDTTEGIVIPTSLIFNANNWNTAQIVKVTGVDDDIEDGSQKYSVIVGSAVSQDTNYFGLDSEDVEVVNRDDDRVGIRVHPNRDLVTTEVGGSGEFSVVLMSQPEAKVTFEVSSSDTTEGVVSPQLITFTDTNWKIAQVVTVTGVEDEDRKDRSYKIIVDPAVSSDKKYNGLDPDDVVVVNKDNRPGVVVYPTGGLTVSEEGSDTSFSIQLTSEPKADVTFSVVSSDTTEGKVLPSSVTFSLDNWGTAQEIMVNSVDDARDDGNQEYRVLISITETMDSDYRGKDPEDVSVLTLDDDRVGIVVGPVSVLSTTESGETVEISVVLSSQPEGDVTLSVESSDTTEGKVLPSSLMFSSTNWDSTQAVYLTGVNDQVDDGDKIYTVIVGERITSQDKMYRALESEIIQAMNVDDDERGIRVTHSGELKTTESGNVATFFVVLTSEPTFDVEIPLRCSDSTEGVISPLLIAFTRNNWNTPQGVVVKGIDDDMDDGDQDYLVVMEEVVSEDVKYNGLNPPDINVRNVNDDNPGIRVAPIEGLTTTEGRGISSFTVELTSEPEAEVTISLRSMDETEGVVSPSLITFTPNNWSIAQETTVMGVDDGEDDGDQDYVIEIGNVESGDMDYNGLDPDDVSVTNRDDDGPGIIIHPTIGLSTTEAGSSAVMKMVFASEPSADVEISMRSSDEIEGVVSPSSLMFSSENWDSSQVITVTGVDDTLDDGDQSYTIVVEAVVSEDSDYNGMELEDVRGVNRDDDGPGVIVHPGGGIRTSEDGSQGLFTVVLTSEPLADVMIPMKSSDETEGLVTPSSITFKSSGTLRKSNWDRPQEVVVTGVDDDEDDGDRGYTILIEAVESEDMVYAGLDPGDVYVINEDDDEAGILVDTTIGLVTDEKGGVSTFQMSLFSRPVSDVTLMFRSTDPEEGKVSPLSLTFSLVGWNMSQSVTVTGVDDALDDGDQVYAVIIDSVITEDPIYRMMDLVEVSIVNRDDDESGIRVLAGETLATTEDGGIDTFSVMLMSEPEAEVPVSLKSSDENEGTVSPSSITFSGGDWNEPQTITVTGLDDNVDDGDHSYTIRFTVSAVSDTNYETFDVPDISVINKDDDTRGVTIIPTGELITAEAGISTTFEMRLTSEPTADVSFSIMSSDTAEGIVIPTLLTFSTNNWNQPQVVMVGGIGDTIEDGDKFYYIIIESGVSNDSLYNGLDPEDISVINKDSKAGFIVKPIKGLITTESGRDTSFTVVLTLEPEADVTIAVSSSDTTEAVVFPTSLTFSSDNWNMPQRINVAGIDDALDDGDQSYTVVLDSVVSEDSSYADLNPDDASLINIDNELPGIILSSTGDLTTSENGDSDTLLVRLGSRPRKEVTISFSSSDQTEGTVSPLSLTFTKSTRRSESNWNILQLIIITGVNDNIDDGDQTYKLVINPVVSKDPDYRGLDPDDILITNLDDGDKAGIIVSETNELITTEAGDDTSFTIVLTSQPIADVKIPIMSSDTTEGKVWPQTVEFSSMNWSNPQIVTIKGQPDDVDDGDQSYIVVIDSVISKDTKYQWMNPPDVSVSNMDDDEAGIDINPIQDLVTTESGGTDTFTVVLTSEPISNVSFSLSSSDDSEGVLWPIQGVEELPLTVPRKGLAYNLRGWISQNRKIILAGLVVGGGIATWALLSEKEPGFGKPPPFPPIPD